MLRILSFFAVVGSFTLVAMVLLGCSSVQFVKAGAAPGEYERARAECEYEAEKATANNSDPVSSGWNQGSMIVHCLNLKGWYRQ